MSQLEHYRGRQAVRTDRSGSGLAWQLQDAQGCTLPGWRSFGVRPVGIAYEGTTGYLAYFFRTRKDALEAGDQLERKILEES